MAERWWDPESTAVALLEPSGDPRLDVANALTQIHRSGAAALKVAAGTPLIDDVTIADSLSQAREAYADPVGTFAGESLGDQNYAELLVRDVSDDADAAAMRLYYACVAKGVSPPIAADRTAAVYGVPTSDLARYAEMATDPRANQIALTDLADRALFGWVARASSAELDTISKAGPEAQQVEDEPRDEDGRWMAGGTTTGPEEIATRPVPKRLVRMQRIKRKKNQRADPSTGVLVSGSVRAGVRSKLRSNVRSSVKASQVQAMTQGSIEKIVDAPTNRTRIPREVIDDIHTITGPATEPYLANDTVFITTYDEWSHFQAKALNSQNRTVFSGKALNEWVGVGSDLESESHKQHLVAIADLVHKDPKFADAPPDVVMDLDDEDQATLWQIKATRSRQEYDYALDKMKRKYLVAELEANGEREEARKVSSEIGNVDLLADDDDPETMVLVWTRAGPSGVRPRVSLAEIVVDEEGARGRRSEGGPQADDIKLDPNLPLAWLSLRHNKPPQGGPSTPFTTYNRHIGARISRFHTNVTDPSNISKAGPAAERVQDEPRDEDGRWTKDVSEGVLVPKQQQRIKRIQRATRSPMQAQLSAQVQSQVRSQVKSQLRPAQLRRAVLRVNEVKKAVPTTDRDTLTANDTGERNLLTSAELYHQLGVTSHAEDIRLDPSQSRWLTKRRVHWGDEIYEAVMDRTDRDAHQLTERMPSITKTYDGDAAGLTKLQEHVNQVLSAGAIAAVSLRRVHDGTGDPKVRVWITDETKPHTGVLHALRWDSANRDQGGQYDLVWEGEKRLLSRQQIDMQVALEWNAALHGAEGLDDVVTTIMNPKVDTWSIQATD